jgi:hypothetical protein
MRRVEGRKRLMALASAAPAWTTGDRELDRLRAYLLEWAQHQTTITAARRERNESCLASFMKADSPTASALLGGSDAWAMQVIDASITDLIELEHGVEMHAALRVRYLNEGLTKEVGMRVRVFRSNRLQHLSLEEADAFADKAEIALKSIVKKRFLPL